ncbi:MAG: hypothetical protein AAGI63_14610 [Planctomycetota bacterium]
MGIAKKQIAGLVFMLPLAAMLISESRVQAQTIPFTVAGRGAGGGFSVGGVPSPFGAKGISFPVGLYKSENGVAISQSFDGVGMGTFKGTFTFVNKRTGARLATTFGDTSNGANSVWTYMAIPVSAELVRILFIAEFNPIAGESTGLFSKVTSGSLTMYALTEPIPPVFDEQGFSVPFTFNWVGTGSLTFD